MLAASEETAVSEETTAAEEIAASEETAGNPGRPSADDSPASTAFSSVTEYFDLLPRASSKGYLNPRIVLMRPAARSESTPSYMSESAAASYSDRKSVV